MNRDLLGMVGKGTLPSLMAGGDVSGDAEPDFGRQPDIGPPSHDDDIGLHRRAVDEADVGDPAVGQSEPLVTIRHAADDAPPRLVLAPAQVAQLLSVEEPDVLASLESGDLKGRKIGTQWRVTRAAVDRFLRIEDREMPADDLVGGGSGAACLLRRGTGNCGVAADIFNGGR